MSGPSQFSTDRTNPGLWTITFSNPPINMFVPTTIVELGALMTDLEADFVSEGRSVPVGKSRFFYRPFRRRHQGGRTAGGVGPLARLCAAPPVYASREHGQFRGRTRGIGNEFVLACDMRFASRQSALFGQPEVGTGLIPAAERWNGSRAWWAAPRALEIVLSADDFDANIAERYGWVNGALDDDGLNSFVDTLVRRLASFDREVLAAAKAQINRFGTPTATKLQSSNDMIFPMLRSWSSAQARFSKIRNIGYGVRSDFELNFGRYPPCLRAVEERIHGHAARLIVALDF